MLPRRHGRQRANPGWDAVTVTVKRRVTLRDVALRASVSPSAASSALRGEGRLHPDTRARILAAADELGYRRNAVARSLRRSGTGVVATVMYDMPDEAALRRPKSFWEQAVFGYVRELASAGIGNVFVPAAESQLLATLPADVVVVFNLPQEAADQVVSVPDGVPDVRVVSAEQAASEAPESPANRPAGRVIWDYHAALGQVLSHLVDAGARAPGLLLPPKPLMPSALIRQAHHDWCQEHGRPELRSEWADIAAGCRVLLDAGCDAVVVHGDDAAGDVDQVLAAIHSAGLRVPQDVLVASISDGARESELDPPVTSLSYDGMASGVQMARAVIDGLATGRFLDTAIWWDLRVRDSTVRNAVS